MRYRINSFLRTIGVRQSKFWLYFDGQEKQFPVRGTWTISYIDPDPRLTSARFASCPNRETANTDSP